MREVDLRGIDLNLLVLLDALIEYRNVTRAADAMHMSQPAMSRALGRLRKLLNDPILVRGGDVFLPTPKARSLSPKLKRLLNDLTVLVSDDSFSPEKLTGYVTLAASEYQSIIFLPELIVRLSQAAPHLDVRVIPLFNIAAELLHDGNVDIAFGVSQVTLPANLYQESLCEDTYITLMRHGHPAVECLSIKQFAALKHVLITAVGSSRGVIDTELNKLGLQRRVMLQLPSLITALAIVAESDFVITLPALIARRYAVQHKLVEVATPVTSTAITHVSIWSEVMDADPAHRWLRRLIREAASQIVSEA
ncbi:MAG: LysR family transcriptional regulator [Pseudanabaena sp.]